MKTATIKLLNKPVLVVELPDHTADFSVINTGDRIAISAFDEYDNCLDVKGIPTNYTLLGKPDEIREEDAAQLIPMYFDHEKTAVEYLIEMIESEIYWNVNPIPTPEIQGGHDEFGNFHGGWDDNWISAFEEAEQKTFDRNRSIILKKKI